MFPSEVHSKKKEPILYPIPYGKVIRTKAEEEKKVIINTKAKILGGFTAN